MRNLKALNNLSCLLNICVTISLLFLLSISQLRGQTIRIEDLFYFESIFQQKNIRVSERITEEWALSNYYIQQTYYDANKDNQIDSIQQIKQVLSIFNLNSSLEILELLDDGKHFDNKSNDGIFGNFLVGEFNEFPTEESNIDIHLDTVGINYSILYPNVTYLPETPNIILPQHKSIVSVDLPEISWKIDKRADGCGLILIDGAPALGEDFSGIIWEKRYYGDGTNFFTEKVPTPLLNNKEYTIIIWAYTNTKQIDNEWRRGAYSIELSKFYLDKLHKTKDFIVSQNFPNPFNSLTIIKYILPQFGKVSINIIDIIGRKVKTLIDKEQSSGEHSTFWNGKDNFGNNVASGIYFYNMKFNGYSATLKMILTR